MNTTIATTTTCNTTAAVSYVKALSRFHNFRRVSAAETASSDFGAARDELVNCAACAQFVNAKAPATAGDCTLIEGWYYTSLGRYQRLGASVDVGTMGRFQRLVG